MGIVYREIAGALSELQRKSEVMLAGDVIAKVEAVLVDQEVRWIKYRDADWGDIHEIFIVDGALDGRDLSIYIEYVYHGGSRA